MHDRLPWPVFENSTFDPDPQPQAVDFELILVMVRNKNKSFVGNTTFFLIDIKRTLNRACAKDSYQAIWGRRTPPSFIRNSLRANASSLTYGRTQPWADKIQGQINSFGHREIFPPKSSFANADVRTCLRIMVASLICTLASKSL